MAARKPKPIVTIVDILIAHELQPEVDENGTMWWVCRTCDPRHRVRSGGQPIRNRNAEHQAKMIARSIQEARQR